MTSLDDARLDRAFVCAEQAVGVSDPNPRVGCVIGLEDGRVLGEGVTQAAGQAHAEVMALAAARGLGADVRGATAWVTLEPCSHHGRTPPCCDALIDAGVSRVVVACLDPNPAVNGHGVERLRQAGIEVVLADEAHARRCRELNIGFFARMTRERPWVRLKIACSLDGRVALADGRSRWITGEQARLDGHRWRQRAGAVLTGVGTVLADDPRLDVRLVPTMLQPLRVVLDSGGRMPVSAAILRPPGTVLWVQAAQPTQTAQTVRATRVGNECERLDVPLRRNGLDLAAVVAELGRRQVNEIHVEAGPRLNASLLQAGLVDEILLYQAPMLIGPGQPLAELEALPALDAARRWQRVSCTEMGEDLRLLLRPVRGDGGSMAAARPLNVS